MARYSVKITTRSFDQTPLGLMVVFSHLSKFLDFAIRPGSGFFAQACRLSSSSFSRGVSGRNRRVAVRMASSPDFSSGFLKIRIFRGFKLLAKDAIGGLMLIGDGFGLLEWF